MVSTDSAGAALLTVDGSDGSCVGLISPGAYSSAVIEADIDFSVLPGSSDTIADWTSFWLTKPDTRLARRGYRLYQGLLRGVLRRQGIHRPE
jgi:hypothetical protein